MRRPHPMTLAAAGLAVLTLVGCTDSTPTAGTTTTRPDATTPPPGARPAAGRALFAPFDSCDQLLGYLKEVTTSRVGPWGLSSGNIGIMPTAERSAAATTTVAAATTVAGAVPVAGAPAGGDQAGSSTTNTQEAGIDEGDEVETDGRHVYSVVDGRLRVVDTTISARQVASLPLPNGRHQLLLDGSRLVLVTSSDTMGGGPVPLPRPMPATGIGRPVPSGFTADGTTVTVYDVTTPASPRQQSQVVLEGDVVAARAAKGTVRLVLRSSLGDRLPFRVPNQGGSDVEREATEINKKVIAQSTIDDWLPRSTVGGGTGGLKNALSCKDIGRPAQYAGLGLTWVASLPLESTTVTGSAGVVASSDIAYAAADTLYVTTTVWPEDDPNAKTRPIRPEPVRTSIHAFGLGQGPTATYLASGQVTGHTLNSYALSEHEGTLRIAVTTDADGFGSTSSSSVHLLQRKGESLTEVGAVGGLGRTERIYAVRYVGPLAYVVTFRQTDPLYVLDLRDPTAPRAVGELKIPGYSAYLHPIGDGRLIGVGQDATDQGRRTGSAVSLFDVSDPSKPTRLAKVRLAEGWSNSEAEYDPHAFLWWAKTGQLVLPVSGATANGTFESAAQVLKVDGATLSIAGKVTHPTDGQDPWSSQLRRSLVVAGQLVTVSPNGIKISDLATLSQLSWVPFTA